MSPISRRALIVGAAGAVAAQSSLAQTNGGTLGKTRFDVDRFVDDVKQAATGPDRQADVEDVLRRAVAQSKQLLAALGEPMRAGIHTLHRDEDLTILNVVWAPLMILLPHNHTMWASIGIYTGREDNILWEKRGNSIAATRAAALSEKDVFGLGADAIHSVTNPIGRLTGAIHIYGGDFFAPGRSEWDAESLRERSWDLEAARDTFTKAVDRFDAVPD